MLRTAQSVYNLTQIMSDTVLWAVNVWVSSLLVKAYSKIEFNSNTINPDFLSRPRSSHDTGMSSILRSVLSDLSLFLFVSWSYQYFLL